MSGSQTDQAIEKKLGALKNQLLDTGRRNRMINYRETARATLRIVTPSYRELFRRIALREESLSFQRPLDQDYDLRAYRFLELMKVLGHEIPVRIGDIGTGAASAAEQKAALRNLRSKAKLALEEQGTNILYLSFGFIRWREKNTLSSPWMTSPLVMVPAALTVRSISAPFVLSRYDDEIAVNPTLAYRFEHDFSLTLPEFEPADEGSLDAYFDEIEKIADGRGWELIREVSLGLVSFQKISMYFDLERKRDQLMASPVVRAVCGDTDAVVLPEEAKKPYDPDAASPSDQYEVIDADSSQQKAVRLARLGVSFVMQGPPGTGKSQTIANIIAAALADGKKVLFVSEKAAALEVVLRRLTEARLSDFCLSLHDYRANKRDVLRQIGDNLHLKKIAVKSSAMNDLIRLARRRDELNRCDGELHEAVQPLNMSLYQVFGELAQFTEAPAFTCSVENAGEISEAGFQQMNYLAEKYARAVGEMSCGIGENPWRGIPAASAGALDPEELKRKTEGLPGRLRELDALMSEPLGPLSLPGASLKEIGEHIENLSRIGDIPLHDYGLHLLSVPERKRMLLAAKKARAAQLAHRNAAYECSRVFDWSIFEAPVSEWIGRFRECAGIIAAHAGWRTAAPEEIYGSAERIAEDAERAGEALQSVMPDVLKLREAAGLPLSGDEVGLDEISGLLKKCGAVLGLSAPPLKSWLNSRDNRRAEAVIRGALRAVRDRSGAKAELERNWLPSVLRRSADAVEEKALLPVSRLAEEIAGPKPAGLCEWLDGAAACAADAGAGLARALEACREISGLSGFMTDDSWEDLLLAKKAAELLEEADGVLPSWLNPARRKLAADVLKEGMERSRRYAAAMAELERAWRTDILNLDAEELLRRFRMYAGLFGHLNPQYKTDRRTVLSYAKNGAAAASDEQLIRALEAVRTAREEEAWARNDAVRLKLALGSYYGGIGTDWARALAGLEKAERLAAALKETPEIRQEAFASLLGSARDREKVRALYRNALEGSALSSLKQKLNRFSGLDLYYGLSGCPAALSAAGRKCAAASAYIRALAAERTDGARDLTPEQLKALVSALKSTEEYERLFAGGREETGLYADGKDYESELFWEEQLDRVAEAERLLDAFGDQMTETLRDVLAGPESLKRLQAAAGAVVSRHPAEEPEQCALLCAMFVPATADRADAGTAGRGMEAVRRAAEEILRLAAECNIYTLSDLPAEEIPGKLKEAENVRECRRAYSDALSACPDLVRRFGKQDDWSGAVSVLEYVNAAAAAGGLNGFGPEFDAYFCGSAEAREQIAARLERLRAVYAAAEPAAAEFAGLFPDGAELLAGPAAAVADRWERCLEHPESLDMWLNYQDAREECVRGGLADFVARVEERDGNVKDPVGCFRFSFFSEWYRAAAPSRPSAARFTRLSRDEAVREFRALDAGQFATARQRIRARIIGSFPDPDLPAAAGDEMAVLNRELAKKQKIMPLRKLFREIPNLLLKLKPCLMMSPLSVARFLEADSYRFDTVIFDEASQIFPQDALGSILRGKQVIVAGDTHQLPPTSFFSSNTGNGDGDYDADDENEDVFDKEIGDSVLEEAGRTLPVSTLLWHYRSRSEELIAFSNREIYGGRLITFPGCRDGAEDTGVEFVYVPDGLYEAAPKNCNVKEAGKCVELIRDHILKYPDRSLGVIAFSEKQQQAILDAVQDFREKNPQYEFFFREDRQDPFFVKNLENVQGDERDTIFFSVGYGYTKEQRERKRPMSLRFGPLGQAGGERRLNVAVTRAKLNVKLVASVLPGDIDPERTRSLGVRLLRSYLYFAVHGTDALRAPFEEEDRDLMCGVIADFLTENGYRVAEKLGCSEYRVDIAVEHPGIPGCRLAAVECGGAPGGARTARERERLHTEVLERMGWRVFRVWAAEWFRNRKAEEKRLLDFLKEAESLPVEYRAKAAPEEPAFEDLVEEIPEEAPADGANPYGFAVYAAADLNGAPPSRPGCSVTLSDRILYAVSVEQPVSVDLLCRRAAPFLGVSRVTVRVTSAVESALLGLRDRVVVKGGFASLKGAGVPVIRIPPAGEEPRPVNRIAPEELMEAMRTVAERSFGLTREGLVAETARALGYSRRGARIQTALEEILDRLTEENVIRMADGKVHAVEVSIHG